MTTARASPAASARASRPRASRRATNRLSAASGGYAFGVAIGSTQSRPNRVAVPLKVK
jgi:hypothetical protein